MALLHDSEAYVTTLHRPHLHRTLSWRYAGRDWVVDGQEWLGADAACKSLPTRCPPGHGALLRNVCALACLEYSQATVA